MCYVAAWFTWHLANQATQIIYFGPHNKLLYLNLINIYVAVTDSIEQWI